MFKNIYFDHVNCQDDRHKFFNSLGKRGFTLSPNKTEHPGKRHCRFIMFEGDNLFKVSYLEFIRVGAGGKSYDRAGISFGYKKKLVKFYKSISKKLTSHFTHKNYSWKENSIDKLPGWNFLNFKNIGMRSIYPWFTEYEPFDSKVGIKTRKRPSIPTHPNTVYSVHGFELTLTAKGHKSFEMILGKKLRTVNKLADGTNLYINSGRVNRCTRVILNCRNIHKARKLVQAEEEFIFKGSEALLLRSPASSLKAWDIVIIQN
ncbi:hypothetical protein A9Q84_00355 [Halobacteriovorax marinus]|uniref:Glyoxalase-like domain-containing protein n=1 Tax=Halobacteriovorax marinus TaxID=97084 RepID=A0A1Y5FH36_9BACT|nr:hypothetical protein A9Q84_00355 [Halobacteriovorax marinus]